MTKTSTPVNAFSAYMNLASAWNEMSMAASEVIYRRSMAMAEGKMTPADAMAMIMEKSTAFAASAEKASVVAARGGDPVAIATAALGPYGVTTRANVRKLRR